MSSAETNRPPATLAVRELLRHGVAFTSHVYTYEEHGGTEVAARALDVPEHAVIKTLVMETDERQPLIVLMHGDQQVSTKQLARVLGVKTVSPCAPQTADKHSGYQVGGTSPFGTRRKMPVYVERSVTRLERIYVNGGRRGFLVGMAPADMMRVLEPTCVDVATSGASPV